MEEIVSYLGNSHYITKNHLENLINTSKKLNLDPDRQLKETDNSMLMEGIYIKVEDDNQVKERMKYVRYTFLQTVEESETHWLDRPIVPNKLNKDIGELF